LNDNIKSSYSSFTDRYLLYC